MRTCPNCTTELVVDGGEHCPVCNALLTSDAPHGTADAADEDMRFDVTEARDDSRDLVGGAKRPSRREELGIEREADIMAGQTRTNPTSSMADTHSQALDDEQVPIQSAPSPTPASAAKASASAPEDKNSVKRLSAQEVESISKNLYGNQTYLSEREKLDLLRKVDPNAKSTANGGQPQPSDSNEQDPSRPRMAKRVRGVAWYYRSWIQIVGEQDLHEHEEIVVNDRPYVLRKKRLSPKVVLAAVAPIAAVILFFLASMLTPSITGKGRIVGFVVDQTGQPYLQAATIRLPETGQTLVTNAQGFFVSDPVKSGSHKVEYVVNGKVVGSDYATVVANEVTTLKLAPTTSAVQAQMESPTPVTVSVPSQDRRPAPERPAQSQPATSQRANADNSDQASGDPNGKILLNANIEGATLALNGKVVGVGNLTYTRLKPGRYDYQVSKDGYQSTSGVVELSAGKTTSLAVQLGAAKQATHQTVAVAPEEQHFRSAVDAVAASDFPTAEKEFQAAIDTKPSYAAAQMGLADLKTKMGRRTEASENYLRAAEIYRVAGDLGNALKACNSAVQTDKTSVAALIGRGNLYLSRGEEIAAIADFETVVGLDHRNFAAYFGLGQARFSQGNAKAAIKHFKDARSLDPKNSETYEYLMLCYFADDNLKEAKKAYDSFKEIATPDQMSSLQQSNKFSAVLRVVQE